MTITPKKPKAPRISGKLVVAVRLKMGLTIEDFADTLGVHPSTVYRWEAATRSTTKAAIVRLISALGQCSDDYLAALGGDIQAACHAGNKLKAARLLLDGASKGP
mgnify:CR=1 FL=1